MDRQEEIGLHTARLLDAHLQRHEEIGIARQHGAHVRLGVDPRLQAAGNFERDVLFVGAGLADGARVFAAVAGVKRDRHQAVDNGFAGFLAGMHLGRLDLRLA